MTELNIVEIVVAVLVVISLVEAIVVCKIIRTANEDREMLIILAKDKMKSQMVDAIENMRKGFENLFNPKDKKDVKKTRTNSKTE